MSPLLMFSQTVSGTLKTLTKERLDALDEAIFEARLARTLFIISAYCSSV
jgi:hypothetical protein